MDSEIKENLSVRDVLIKIRKHSSEKKDSTTFKFVNDVPVPVDTSYLIDMISACDNLLGFFGSKNQENSKSWSELIRCIFYDPEIKELANEVRYIIFLYVVANELLVIDKTRHEGKIEAALNVVKKAKVKYDENHKSLAGVIDDCFDRYNSFWRYKALEERVNEGNANLVEAKVSAGLKDKEKELKRLKHRIDENKEILEGIEDNTGFTALFSGLNKYASSLKGDLRKTSEDVKNIKYLLFFTPACSMLLSLIVNVGYGFYISTVSIMVVLGLFLKVSLRKEDQYQQLLNKVENRVAVAVFHKYRLKDIGEKEAEVANEKFHSFIYSEVETSEWNAPDVGESIVSILREIKK